MHQESARTGALRLQPEKPADWQQNRRAGGTIRATFGVMDPARPGQLYARAAPRLQAYLRDFFVYVGTAAVLMTMAVVIGTSLATQICVVAYIGFAVLYEPVCITTVGGTVGHLTQNLRVVRASDLGRVSFVRAVVRTLIKGVFGLWVFIAVYFTRRCQSIHDLVAGTVVIPRNPTSQPSRGFAMEKARPATNV